MKPRTLFSIALPLLTIASGVALSAGCSDDGTTNGGGPLPEAGGFDVQPNDGGKVDTGSDEDTGTDAKSDAGPSEPTMLWVTNNSGGTMPAVLGFELSALEAGGDVAPKTTFSGATTTFTGPQCVAFDASGNMWVVDSPGGSMDGKILKFDAASVATGGDIAPSVTIAGASTKLRNPAGCAFDGAGALWVANIDPVNADSDIVVSFSAASLATGGDVAPSVSIGNGANLCNTIDVAFDPSGNLWTASLCTHISGYKKSDLATGGSLTPQNTINQPTGVNAITFDGSGNLWTSMQGGELSITKFDAASLPSAAGNVTPSITIKGASTELDSPSGLAVVKSGIWNVEPGSNKLLRFDIASLAAGTNDVAPSKVVSGASTKLSSPTYLRAH